MRGTRTPGARTISTVATSTRGSAVFRWPSISLPSHVTSAIAVLDEVRSRGQVSGADFPTVFGRISFFVNAGVRFVEEHAKLRAMAELWGQIGLFFFKQKTAYEITV